MESWYPENKKELENLLDKFLNQKLETNDIKNLPEKIHGIIVPHAGYEFSGEITGKVFSLFKNKKIEKAIVLGPSHYTGFYGVRVLQKNETPIGRITITKNEYNKLAYEHSVDNQIPFLQRLDIWEVLPLIIGELSSEDAEEIAKKIADEISEKNVLVISSDLSHFLSYDEAVKKDKKSIKMIEELDIKNFDKIDACGIFPLLILMHLCKIKKWKPQLIEYKNSGDIVNDKKSVVGYAAMVF